MAEQLVINLALKDSSFNQQIKSVNTEIKKLESEFKLAETSNKDFSKTTEGLTAKIKLNESSIVQLSKKLDIYKQKQDENKKTMNKVNEAYVKQSEKVDSLKSSLANAGQEYGKSSEQVKKLSDELKKAEKSLDTKRNAVVNADNAMKNLDTTINGTQGEINKLESEIEDLNSELDNIDSGNVDGLANSFDDAGQKALDFGAKMTIVGAGVKEVGEGMKNAGKEVVDTLADMVEKGAEYQVEQGAITTMLGDQEGAVRSWADTQAESLGMTEQQLTQVTAKNMMLAEKMGLSGDKAREMAKGISVATQDLATFYDVPAEEMQQKFNSAMNGSTEIMDQYGVDISVASLEQSNYVQSLGKTWKEMTEAEKKQARYNKILEDTAKVQGNAAKEAEGFSVQGQLLKTNIQEMVKTLGEKLIPVLEPIVKIIGDVVDKTKTWIENNPQLATTLMIIVGVIGGLLLVVGSLLVPLGMLIITMGALSTAMATAGGFAAFFSASILPIIAVIGIVIGVIVALVMAIKSNWEEIKEATNQLLEECSPTFEALGQAFSRLWEMCKSIYETIIKPLFEIIGIVIASCIRKVIPIINSLVPVFTTAFNLIASAWDFLKPVFDIIMWILKQLAKVATGAMEMFVKDITGAMDKVLQPIQWVIDKVGELLSWLGGLGDKISGTIKKLNPFKSFSLEGNINVNQNTRNSVPDASPYSVMRTGMPMPLDMSSLDNIALSGSYYTPRTMASGTASEFIKVSSGIQNNITGTLKGNSTEVNLNKLIDKFTNEMNNMKQDNKSMMSMLSSALNSMADAINNINLKDKIVVEGSVTVDNKIDGRQLSKVMAPYAAKANAKYEKNNLR